MLSQKPKKTWKVSWLKSRGLGLMLFAMLLFLQSCQGLKGKLSTIKPVDVWIGNAGEQPTEVWPTMDWMIVDSGKYLCKPK